MANSVNKVILVGNLGNDPEVRSTSSGSTIVSLSIATSRSFKDKSDNWQEDTQWHRVKLFTYLAEKAAQYLSKGSKVYIEGRIEYGSYEKDGITRYTTDIIAENLVMLDKREGSNSYQSQPSYPDASSVPGPDEDEDDGVPF